MAFRSSASSINIGTKKYETSVFTHKINHLNEVISKFGESEEYFTDVSRLFGEDTFHFKSLDELDNFLTIVDAEEEGQNYSLDAVTKASLQKLKVAVSEYKDWKVTVNFDREVRLSDVAIKVSLLYTLSADQMTQISDSIAVSIGFSQIRDIVKTAVRSMIEEFNNDKDIKRRRRELALVFLKLILNVVNAGVVAEIVQKGIDATLEGEKKLVLAALGGETLKAVGLESSDGAVRILSNLFNEQITAKSIVQLIDLLWDLSIKFMDKNIDLNHKLITTLTPRELETEIKNIRAGKDLRKDLCEHSFPQRFNYNNYVAEKIANKMKQENEALIYDLCASMTEAESEAKLIVTLEGEKSRQKLNRDVVRFFNGVAQTTDFYRRKNRKKGYHDVEHKSEFSKFKIMVKGSNSSKIKYFPTNIDNNALILLETAPETGIMHVGGKYIRKYVYLKLGDLEGPVYGYKKSGSYKDKNRIRDTWRADQVIQLLLIKSQNSTDPHAPLPFSAFKSTCDIANSILDLLKVNPFFKTQHYNYETPHPTPLYLFTHLSDYSELLNRPGVRKYLNDHIDFNLILLSVTDPNINGLEDKPRLVQALNDTFSLLKKIDYKPERELDEVYQECLGYIELQCSNRERHRRIRGFEEFIHSCDPSKSLYDKEKYMEQLQSSLRKCKENLAHIIAHAEALREKDKTNERIILIERLVVHYLLSDVSPGNYDIAIKNRLHVLLPIFLANKELSAEEIGLAQRLKKSSARDLPSQKIYSAVLKHHRESADLEKFTYYQNMACRNSESESEASVEKSKLSEVSPKSTPVTSGLVTFGQFSPRAATLRPPIREVKNTTNDYRRYTF